MKPLPLPLAALLSLSLAACGGAGTSARYKTSSDLAALATSTSTAAPDTPGAGAGGASKDAEDGDSDAGGDDDTAILDFGHAASAEDTRAATTVLERYYAAAAAGRYATVCAMLVPNVAERLAEESAHVPGAPSRRGSCAATVSALLGRKHRRLAADLAKLDAIGLRLEGEQGLVLLRFGATAPIRNFRVRRAGSTWKLRQLLDTGMP